MNTVCGPHRTTNDTCILKVEIHKDFGFEQKKIFALFYLWIIIIENNSECSEQPTTIVLEWDKKKNTRDRHHQIQKWLASETNSDWRATVWDGNAQNGSHVVLEQNKACFVLLIKQNHNSIPCFLPLPPLLPTTTTFSLSLFLSLLSDPWGQ